MATREDGYCEEGRTGGLTLPEQLGQRQSNVLHEGEGSHRTQAGSSRGLHEQLQRAVQGALVRR